MSEQTELTQQGGVEESIARAWKELPQVQEKAKKLGFDVDKVTLGYIVDHITGDDVNAFGPLLLNYSDSRHDEVQKGRDFILARLDWEANSVLLPQNIRERLQEVSQAIEESNWTTEQGFRDAYSIWRTRAKEYVEEQGKSNPELVEARRAYRKLEDRIRTNKRSF